MGDSDYERGYRAGQFEQREQYATPRAAFNVQAEKDQVSFKMNMRALDGKETRHKEYANQCAMLAMMEPELARHLGERMIKQAGLADAWVGGDE